MFFPSHAMSATAPQKGTLGSIVDRCTCSQQSLMRIAQPANQFTLKTREPARTKTKQHQLTGKGQYGRIDDGGESMRREFVTYSVATEAGSE